ncbi:MAG TPA: dicarboxylate/amino acid:cation symporter, partial [Pseudoxanthomonas sp.]|nr:dicarboxylate/amino acid:cation symporter [Pseudoxanthomonas sp.]
DLAAYAAIVAPALLSLVPRSPQLAATLAGSASAATASGGAPSLAEWVGGVIPSNAIMAAAQGAMLPVVVFALFF